MREIVVPPWELEVPKIRASLRDRALRPLESFARLVSLGAPVGQAWRMSEHPLEPAKAVALLDAFAARRVVVLGDLVADHYLFGQTDRVSREAPVLIVRYESSEVKLGGAANAAANVRALGGRVTVVGVLGEDSSGSALREQLAALGIDARVG